MIHPLGTPIWGRVRFSGTVTSVTGLAYVNGSPTPSAIAVTVTADGDCVDYSLVTSTLAVGDRVRVKITATVNGVTEVQYSATRDIIRAFDYTTNQVDVAKIMGEYVDAFYEGSIVPIFRDDVERAGGLLNLLFSRVPATLVADIAAAVQAAMPTPPTAYRGGGASLALGSLTTLSPVTYGTGVTRQAFAGGKASGVAIPAGNTWSLTVWLKPTAGGLKVAFGNTGSGTFWGGLSNSKFAFSLGTVGVQEASTAAAIDAWSKVRLVCQGTGPDTGMKWYINDVLAGSTTTTATAAGIAGTTLCVGGFDANDNYNWPGLIDDLAVWSTAITSTPTAVLGNESGLLRAYNFDGNLSDAVASLAADTPVVTALSSTSVTLKAYAKGVGPLSYQWHRSATPGFVAGGGTAIAGATSDTLSDTPAGATRWYYAYTATDGNGQTLTSFERPVLLGVTTALPTPTVVDLPTPKIDLVNIGDSTEADATWNDNVSPIKRAVGLLTALTPCVVTYRNYAVSGTSATQWAQAGIGTYLESLIVAEGGSLVGKTVHLRLGMNDAQLGVSVAGYAAAMAAIVARIMAVGGKVIISYPTFREAGSHWPTHPSAGFDQSTTPLLVSYQAVIDALVDGVDVFAGDRTSYDIFAAHAASLLYDRIHENALGAVVMARAVAAAVIRAVQRQVQLTSATAAAINAAVTQSTQANSNAAAVRDKLPANDALIAGEGGGTGTGDGDIEVGNDYEGEDNLRLVAGGNGIAGAKVRFYDADEYDDGVFSVVAMTETGGGGRIDVPVNLDPGNYVVQYTKSQVIKATTKRITVVANGG